MICTVDYRDSTGIVRDWLIVKYQVLNNCFNGTKYSTYYGKPELLYDHTNPGSALFFNDSKYEIMKNAGYFLGRPGRYLGEGGVVITNKAKEELNLEQKQIEKKRQLLLEKKYRLFMEPDTINKESRNAPDYFNRNNYESEAAWESDINRREHYFLRIHDLYLIPEAEIKNIVVGTLLVSSTDAQEIVYDGNLDLGTKNGFSKYGLRLMPMYADELLFDTK